MTETIPVPVEQKDLGNCFKCGNALSVYCSYCNTPEAAPKPAIPEDEDMKTAKLAVIAALQKCRDTNKTRYVDLADAAIRTLISLGWKK